MYEKGSVWPRAKTHTPLAETLSPFCPCDLTVQKLLSLDLCLGTPVGDEEAG